MPYCDDKYGMQFKIKILFITFVISNALHAEVFTHQYERNKSESIEIVTVDGMQVSQSCSNDKKNCWASFKNIKFKKRKKTKLLGNPASIFCNDIKGESRIFKDSKNNEYDFCKFKKDFYVDSWDLYKRFNK